MTLKFKAPLAALLASGLLAGCSSSDTQTADAPTPKDQAVVVATVAANFSSGAHAVFDADAPFTGADEHAATISDVTVASNGQFFYRIERFNADNVAKFDIASPSTPIWQYSTQDAGATKSGNPQTLVFASDSKAYLPRLGSSSVWIVDPSVAAGNEPGFKTGALDLSAYNDADGTPEPVNGVIVNGKLFLLLQGLVNFVPGQAHIAVFDVATDGEIDTGKGGALKGIPLSVKNPGTIQYSAATGMIYVAGVGKHGFGTIPAEYTGGIEAIDPDDYSTDLILDDGDATTHPIGQTTDVVVVSASKGYVIGAAKFGESGLYEFHPITGALVEDAAGNPVAVAGLSGVDLRDINVDSKGKLWVSIADTSAPGLRVIDTSDNSVVEQRVATVLNPTAIVFADAP